MRWRWRWTCGWGVDKSATRVDDLGHECGSSEIERERTDLVGSEYNAGVAEDRLDPEATDSLREMNEVRLEAGLRGLER
jgi:hypothetical protein